MRKIDFKYKLVGDFETTVYEGQEYTEVWASAVVEIGTEEVKIFHSIDETFDYLISLKDNIIIYYHNLAFDGEFWVNFLLKNGYKLSTNNDEYDPNTTRYNKPKDMMNNTFTLTISDIGQWYRITIKVKNRIIEIRDSLKLLPFSVKQIGKGFDTKHKKLDMEYKGFRYAGCVITDKEKEYISNDVLVVKEALEFMFAEGHDALTIGSCCLKEFRALTGFREYAYFFPDLTKEVIDPSLYGAETAFDYIYKSYKGGWCYLVPPKANKQYNHGITADVNSLYPSMMLSESGNRYPIGLPTFWKGNYLPIDATLPDRYFFIRFKCRFYIKKGKLPTVQIKKNMLYPPREWLESSDVWCADKSMKSPYYIWNGEKVEAIVELTMTQTDFKLFLEHYNVYKLEILDGCYFDTATHLFDMYVDKYRKIKETSTGARRTLAKLFSNNLYGKMASTKNSNFKYPVMGDDGTVKYLSVRAQEKQAGYIPIGSAITSYARNFTIRTAQANYHGADKPGFIYADTDSIHCDLAVGELQNVSIDDKKYLHWKIEKQWDKGLFVRAKTYMEHDDNGYDIKCAGMPENVKAKFIDGLNKGRYNISDFKKGLKLDGKLVPKHIKGGIVLCETSYEIRN